MELELDGQELEHVKESVYLGSTVTETAKSKWAVKIRIANATTALSWRVKIIWGSRNIKMMKTQLIVLSYLVISILSYA